VHVQLNIRSQRRLTVTLLCVVALLICASLAVQFAKHATGHDHMYGLVPLFYVDLESNIPTWYSSSALLLASVLLSVVALAKFQNQEPFRRHWMCLSAIFAYLAVDEVAMLHEYPIAPLRSALNATGALHYTWVIPGFLAVAIVGVCYLKFLKHLPARTRNLFIVAGMTFVGGAIGLEMISGIEASAHDESSINYMLIVTAEEFMEMLGIVIFIHGISDYILRNINSISIQIGEAVSSSPSPIEITAVDEGDVENVTLHQCTELADQVGLQAAEYRQTPSNETAESSVADEG